MKLHNFHRSSAAYRVRILMNLKGLSYDYASVNLMRGESRQPAYEAINPQGIVPTLEDDGHLITQSMAICEYLEEKYPNPPVLPRDLFGRARVRGLALAVACEIHAAGGGRPQRLIGETFNATPEQRTEWMCHFIRVGFTAIETMLAGSKDTGRFCHGDTPTLADAFLVPQVYNARMAKVDLSPYPTIQRICANCDELEAFAKARPEVQPDAN
ncbi:MAG TPA: maleylacetoacetate isomerase [Candidatus Binataceae bacterium]|nr:maleylacetoacetate isomerase [Candidatus Binataceae bacterium]